MRVNALAHLPSVALITVLMSVAFVRAIDAPVEQLGQSISVVLANVAFDTDVARFDGVSWLYGLLVVGDFIALVLLLMLFYGGIPLGIAGFVLSGARGRVAQRIRSSFAEAMPHLLVFHVALLLLTVLLTAFGLLVGGREYARSGWAWFLMANIVASAFAVPAWRQMMREDLRVRLLHHVP